MNLQKTIIGVTIAAVGACGVFLGIEGLKSNQKDIIQETTANNSDSNAVTVTELNLAEPPTLLEMLSAEKPSENPDQTTTPSETIKEESTPQNANKFAYNDNYSSADSNNNRPVQRSRRVYIQQEEPANNDAPKVETNKKAPEPTPPIAAEKPETTPPQEEKPHSSPQDKADQATESTDDDDWFKLFDFFLN